MNKQDFIQAGFTVVGADTNPLPQFNSLRELQDFIRANNLDDEETLENNANPLIKKIIVQTLLTLPIDEKVNGYGLNFVGRHFARAKYAQKTDKELRLNTEISKNIDTTENLVLKGDNLDSLKILKSHYSGKIKCIYIDPPYNTTSDEFVYPDKFDKEEAEVLGLANLSESDFARMDFSFKSKKSHNGWLAFMYPRLLLARDLLSKDGVIFISIDDNEQANLKLLCDDVFGEENFVANLIWKKKAGGGADAKYFADDHEYVLCYSKIIDNVNNFYISLTDEQKKSYNLTDDNFSIYGFYKRKNLYQSGIDSNRPNLRYEIDAPDGTKILPPTIWRWSKETFDEALANNEIDFVKNNKNEWQVYTKMYLNKNDEEYKTKPRTVLLDNGLTRDGNLELKEYFQNQLFSYPKPTKLIKHILSIISKSNSIILDFFAGSGTTGHAVMQLNAEDGGNRKFILCQIDEPIKEDKPAYKFCIENNLPPVISSITIERLKRAGEKIKNSLNHDSSDSDDLSDSKKGKKVATFDIFNHSNQENQKNQGSDNNQKNQGLDIGFKVFDSVQAPKLTVDDNGQISITENDTDALSRIYNMIFTVGLDEPSQVPEEVVKDCMYKIGNHYYITNSQKINSDDYSNAIKNGKVFIDGWTASLNGTLQNYKEDVKIVY